MKKNSIQGKVLRITIIPFIVIITAVFIVFITAENKLLYDNFYSELILKSEANLLDIDSAITRYTQAMSGFVFDLENATDRTEETYKRAIDNKLSSFPQSDVSAFYIAYGDRNYLYETLGWVPNSEYDVTTRPWYTTPVSTGRQSIITYADANSGVYFLCISEQIETDTGEPAVIALYIVISSAFEAAKMRGEQEYFFVQDTDGVVIYHPNTEFMPHDGQMIQLTDAHSEYAKLGSLNSGSIVNIKDYNGKTYAFTAIDLSSCGFRIFTGIETDVVNTAITNILTIGAALVLVMLFAYSVVLTMFVKRGISAPLRFAAGYLDDVATTGNLDLAERRKSECAQYLRSNDEISDMLSSANDLFEMMRVQVGMLKKIAEKDLDVQVNPRSSESMVDLIAVRLVDELNTAMNDIQQSSEQVFLGSKQIADGAATLAKITSEQNSTVEHLTSAIKIVSEKTRISSEMANRANNLGKSIKQSAEKGNEHMGNMISAVNDINVASQSIGKVIKVIDDIAFQTNILALNAAVEAARAGQHGKGFAVVADEVRSLAAKSAEAAKDTSALIEGSMQKAELGARIAGETAQSLTEIVEGINESSSIISEIARYTMEQNESINELNGGMQQVAKVVQVNSSTAQESAASAQEMSTQSYILSDIVAKFKLRDRKVTKNNPQTRVR